MATFTTRVELHNPIPRDYDELHEAMEGEGFSRRIKSDDGIIYVLPLAEYSLTGDYSRAQVLAKAKQAANRTRKTYSILVTESKGRTWHGLQET